MAGSATGGFNVNQAAAGGLQQAMQGTQGPWVSSRSR